MTHSPTFGTPLKILSWNLLRHHGATLEEVLNLVRMENPDVILMQEAQSSIDALPQKIGGYYTRNTLPERTHGTACWSRLPFTGPPIICPLPPGLVVRRTAQILSLTGDFGSFSIANVHLSHGQVLNRRQLKIISAEMRERAIIIGDFNLVGPVILRGFRDIGPREKTHRMLDRVPLRLDRCLARGFVPLETHALPRFRSDHRPISVTVQAALATPLTDREETTSRQRFSV